jgi:hypothetical protein
MGRRAQMGRHGPTWAGGRQSGRAWARAGVTVTRDAPPHTTPASLKLHSRPLPRPGWFHRHSRPLDCQLRFSLWYQSRLLTWKVLINHDHEVDVAKQAADKGAHHTAKERQAAQAVDHFATTKCTRAQPIAASEYTHSDASKSPHIPDDLRPCRTTTQT